MRITPIDIRKQEFRRAMRGYDVDEVDTFMAMMADEMEELIGSAQQANSETTSLKERLGEYQQMEATMRETLITVQKAAEEKRAAAFKEADIVMKEAEIRAGQWIEDAYKSIREIKKELAKLRGMRDSYVTRLRMLVQAQLDMLKLAEMEEETPEESLDLFEEKLEKLTTRAKERVAEAVNFATTDAGGEEGDTTIETDDEGAGEMEELEPRLKDALEGDEEEGEEEDEDEEKDEEKEEE